MTTAKILRALEKAACTLPADCDKAANAFMEAIGSSKAEEGTAFESGYYCSSPGDDSEERLVLGWLSEARTLKSQADKLSGYMPRNLGLYRRQYRAELRKLSERIHTAMEEHTP